MNGIDLINDKHGTASGNRAGAYLESILWSQPVPNYVLLLSKVLATLLVTLALVALVAAITIILQAVKHNGPIELMAYAKIYFVIVVPNAIFMAAAALSL